jgi:hypothetical protein
MCGAQPIPELDEDGIALVGCRGALLLANLPHVRSTCLANPFTAGSAKRTVGKNSSVCGLCYCYVCDQPAVECPNWTSLDTSAPAHCNAHDELWMWKTMRRLNAEARSSMVSS